MTTAAFTVGTRRRPPPAVMSRRGAEGSPVSPPSNSRKAAATSCGVARRPSETVTASVWPSVTAARVHVALTGRIYQKLKGLSAGTVIDGSVSEDR